MHPEAPAAPAPSSTSAVRTLRVYARHEVADGVIEFTLRHADGRRLPDWAPGAHIDLVLPGGRSRQYSLCGDRWDAHSFRIAVRRMDTGRGGSTYLHDRVRVGDLLEFAGPRNNFRMGPGDRYLFVAGGIGITPLLPMVRQAQMLGADWNLLYLGRSRSSLPYVDELTLLGARVTVNDSSKDGHADLARMAPSRRDTRVYACGPEGLLSAVEAWAPGLDRAPRVERFAAPADDRPLRPFEVVAARSGITARVEAEATIVEALRGAGVDIMTSCAQGVCGTCETDVLEGRPDHRDSVLDERARAAGQCLMPCVSRSLDERLVLDL